MRAVISDREMTNALEGHPNFDMRVSAIAKLYSDYASSLAEREPRPNVIVCALNQQTVDLCTVRKVAPGEFKRRKEARSERRARQSVADGQRFLFEELNPAETSSETVSYFSDLRRAIKVLTMDAGIPTQVAWPRALGLGENSSGDSQDAATRAWNFITGLYYKAGGVPWRLAGNEDGTCFVGISFYREIGVAANDGGPDMRTAMAQTFTSTCDGFVLRGATFNWDQDANRPSSPHLDGESAQGLVKQVLEHYKRQNSGALPKRIVFHKSSRYWEEEVDGFLSGCEGVPQYDLVTLQPRHVQFYRTGLYPPLRGTHVYFSDQNQLIYTTGYVPSQRSYNGPRVPQPLEVVEHIGDSPWSDVLREILGLTKLNWNTADFACSEPITLAFARRVGGILRELGPERNPRSEYRFYM